MRALWPAALLLLTIALPRPACAQAIKGEVSAVMENGFARLVFTLAEDVESQVKVANGIIIVSYRRPIAVNVDKLAANAPGYVSAARRDPDGKAIRIALARKVTVNSIAAAERLFVDLLPEPWAGLPPGLPTASCASIACSPARPRCCRSGCGSPASPPLCATSSICPS